MSWDEMLDDFRLIDEFTDHYNREAGYVIGIAKQIEDCWNFYDEFLRP